jgi:peptidoglycan/LPS O-acetylase OafA/YrhL
VDLSKRGTMAKKSYASVSLLRLVAIALVFTFHVFYFGSAVGNYPWVYLFSGAVQSFFFLSGLLYSKRKTFGVGFAYHEGVKLFGPCLVYFIVLLFADFSVMSFRGEAITLENIKMTMGNVAPSGVYNIQFGNLWFLPALFVCYLLTPLLAKIATKSKKLLLILALAENAVEVALVIAYGLPCVGIPYLWGYLIGVKDFTGEFEPSEKKKPIFFIWPWLVLFAILAWNFSDPYFTGIWDRIAYYFNGPLKAFFGIFFSLAFLRSTRFLNKTNEPHLLKFMGNMVFWIYLVHESVMTGFFNPLLYGDNLVLGALYALIATLVLSFALKALDDGAKYFVKAAHSGGRPIPF